MDERNCKLPEGKWSLQKLFLGCCFVGCGVEKRQALQPDRKKRKFGSSAAATAATTTTITQKENRKQMGRQAVGGRGRGRSAVKSDGSTGGTYPSDPDLTYPQNRSTSSSGRQVWRLPTSDLRPEGPPPPAGSPLGCCWLHRGAGAKENRGLRSLSLFLACFLLRSSMDRACSLGWQCSKGVLFTPCPLVSGLRLCPTSRLPVGGGGGRGRDRDLSLSLLVLVRNLVLSDPIRSSLALVPAFFARQYTRISLH